MKRFCLIIAFLLYTLPAFAEPSCLQLPIDGDGIDVKDKITGKILDDYANDTKHGAFRPEIPKQLTDLYPKLAYDYITIGFPPIVAGKPQFSTLYACFLDSLVIPPGLGPMTRDEAAMLAHNRDPKVPFKPDAIKPKEPKTTAELFFNRVWRTAWRYLGPALAWATSSTDNFNRGSGSDLGAAWDPYNDGASTPCTLDADRVTGTTDSARCVEGYSTYIPGANQYVQFVLKEITWEGTFTDASAYVRLAAPTTLTGYACRLQPSDQANRTRIRRYDGGGSNSSLANDTTTVWADGDVVRCEVNGTTITAKQNGVTVLTWPGDGTYASGRGGIGVLSTPSVGNFNWIDDFEVGDLGGAAVAVRHRPLVLQ